MEKVTRYIQTLPCQLYTTFNIIFSHFLLFSFILNVAYHLYSSDYIVFLLMVYFYTIFSILFMHQLIIIFMLRVFFLVLWFFFLLLRFWSHYETYPASNLFLKALSDAFKHSEERKLASKLYWSYINLLFPYPHIFSSGCDC